MRYERIREGRFLERPNRFVARVEIDGRIEIVHVKNTGRCAELFVPGAVVYVQETDQPRRRTRWDLIAVKKGELLVNVDSQAPNQAAREWIEAGGLFPEVRMVRPETTYGNSRFDLYVEYGKEEGRRAFVEVKGVTLEGDGEASFPDAPSQRAVKHVEELRRARKEGYEAYVLFVVQMRGMRYFTPNRETHPQFARALEEAAAGGVRVLARECAVEPDALRIAGPLPVVLGEPILHRLALPLIRWYRACRRDLPWRESPGEDWTAGRRQQFAYHVWVSEIMLQQTRVEAVRPYYRRFLEALPTVKDLAEAPEDRLLKLWEGLGYYNRVRNMQKAARQIMVEYRGEFPGSYEQILRLSGIGSYTAGAVASFAFGLPYPAVDGNVLRVVSRILASREDIGKASVKKAVEEQLSRVLADAVPEGEASDFNQGLIELGAIVCAPGGEPKCGECPAAALCRARALGCQRELPVKRKDKERRIEERTILLFRDGENTAIRKRPGRGLLAGLYEFPGLPGHLSAEEVVAYSKKIGLTPVRVKPTTDAKHVFSHVEWHMKSYEIRVDELEKRCTEPLLFVPFSEIQRTYPMPSAFAAFLPYVAGWSAE